MNKLLKQEKGVTLISLAAAVIVMGIITTLLMYSIRDANDTGKLTDLYSDLDNLTDKVSNYYTTYGKIPAFASDDYDDMVAEISAVVGAWEDSPVGVNDSGRFVLLDLSALENLTLNYGKDFENVKNSTTIGNNRDLFIVNENSHNIFYLKGIKVNNKKYYTHQDKDTEKVNLRYVEGIKIPDGYKYLSGTKATGIIITDGTKYYKYEDGIYKNYVEDGEGDGTTISVELTEHDERAWSLPYEENTLYRDENGENCYIPAGFMVSKLDNLNKINGGLVIKKYTPDSEIAEGKTRMDYGDEYVWIKVPYDVLKNIPIRSVNLTEDSIDTIKSACKEVEDALKEYTKDYREEGYEDTWYDGCGLTEAEYYKLKYNMLKSIKENGGFYVGRYEAGKESSVAVSQRNKRPYYYIVVSEALDLAENGTNNNYTTSLMFGIQWDLICKFIEESGQKSQYEIKTNSKDWGNYKISSFIITSNNAECFYPWEAIDSGEVKEANSEKLLTTGSSNQNLVLNIYDLAGNVMEFTLEKNGILCTLRGGGFQHNGENAQMNFYQKLSISKNFSDCGFRVCLFK